MTMTESARVEAHRIGLAHAAATGAAALVFLFILFWGSAASGALPHLRSLFGPMGAGSPFALSIGAAYAVVIGAVAGLLLAIFYNFFSFLRPNRNARG
jgi:hypothetical protein